MSDQRILKDTAHATAKNIVGVFASLLRDEELKDAYDELLTQVTEGMQEFAAQTERERHRLRKIN